MNPAARVMVASVASALLCTGCATAVPLPIPPSQDDTESVNQTLLDLTYEGLDLEGVMRRLTTSTTHATGDGTQLFDCITDAGLVDVGVTWDSSAGYGLTGNDSGTSPSTADKIDFYRCVAEFPSDFGRGLDTELSASETDYLADYWTRWVVPCLARTGHVVFVSTDAPMFGLSPYDRISYRPDEVADFDSNGYPDMRTELIAQCGEPYGLITRLGG